ncbi:MAG: class I SAM-dependent methyltransferase [Phormidium tanganyikae FI6-MK23]|jgi:2-polyprenyl-3-methyl-5-hydroxy-6-metoxy-1,4-benzoquinol methylase|nr:class I SAM-dependent methyltransferase [Phormidium tanganyikae FI6-MK23]
MLIKSSLKNIELVDRIQFLQELCRGQRVLHLGATDAPLTQAVVETGTFLHHHLEAVADHIVGIDLDESAIAWLRQTQNVNNIQLGDIEKLSDYPSAEFDVIVAGEIFEHLSSPGLALNCLRQIMRPQSQLVISVPNSYSLKGFLRAASGHEFIHPDHTLHHSPHTLKILLSRYGFEVKRYFSYINGGTGVFASIANQYLRYNPQLAEGIGVVCSLPD